jgi:hypothetical protein
MRWRGSLSGLLLVVAAVRVGSVPAQAPPPAAAPPATAQPAPAAAQATPSPAESAKAQEERNLNELRNTVVNLLQALVDRGIITREQADAMVKAAQEKAAATAAAAAQQQKAEEGAVRVPYVPEIVKDQIRDELAAELGPSVKQQVVQEVSSKGSLFSALPEWIQRMQWSGDIRLRGEADDFANNNATNYYLDYNAINSAGGVSKAGSAALLNTTQDDNRLRTRLRFGFDDDLGSGWSMAMRLATGSTGEVIATTNQTLGTYGQGYTTTLDQAFLRWTGRSASGQQVFTAYGGRFDNPWISTDLIWYNDLTFEGIISNYRVNLSSNSTPRHDFFVTLGALPLTNVSPFTSDPTTEQKWLLAGQMGLDFLTDNNSRLRFGAAYYDYEHITGIRNPFNSTLYNWSAPAFVQKGNTMFNIANTSDPTVQLFGLAAEYRIVDLTAIADLHVLPRYSLGVTLEALKNIGFNVTDVEANYGSYVAPRVNGYRADLSFGTSTPPGFGSWRASVGYRYLQRDAVLDAFNDEDFHLGGTDTRGYTLIFDWSFNPRVWLRMKYMAANAIDDPPLTIDVFQLDMNARF